MFFFSPVTEHVWQVTLAKRGLGAALSSDATPAVYRLCLTDKVLSLIRKDSIEPQIELSLSSIRSCGNLKTYFFLEIGRSSSIGAGELWMETEDTNIAQNVHQTVYHAMSSNYNSREDLGPKDRHRSSSATESSKPTNIAARRQPGPIAPTSLPFTQDVATPSLVTTEAQLPFGTTTHNTAANETMAGCLLHQTVHQQQRIGIVKPSERRHSVSGPLKKPREYNITGLAGNNTIRERCDSMPSRARTTSEGNPIPFLSQQRRQPYPVLKPSAALPPTSPPHLNRQPDYTPIRSRLHRFRRKLHQHRRRPFARLA
ncbi:PTB domain (IRS-1 type) [Popillia japonica]|uniref:PTB domain (IRS-1 type) n=1 Tax=Popillia japonica TaxID=7064 RepID=A0AAW1IFD3_POPJA